MGGDRSVGDAPEEEHLVAIDSSAPRSRRAILAGALGGAGALIAHSLGRATPALAANDESLLLGRGSVASENAATNATLVNSAASPALGGQASGANTALAGTSAAGVGVWGASATNGGVRFTGVVGHTGDGSDVAPDTSFTGVYGFSEDPDNSTAAGVWGDTATGTGVYGSGYTGVYGTGAIATMGDTGGGFTGVYGFAGNDTAPAPTPGSGVVGRVGVGGTYGVVAVAGGTTQFAAYVAGRLKVNARAGGRTAIGSTATSKKITLAGVTSSSFVVATLQTAVSGCYVRNVVCGAGYFTIYLSKAPGKSVVVGYLIVN
jgi:hypothetical protein